MPAPQGWSHGIEEIKENDNPLDSPLLPKGPYPNGTQEYPNETQLPWQAPKDTILLAHNHRFRMILVLEIAVVALYLIARIIGDMHTLPLWLFELPMMVWMIASDVQKWTCIDRASQKLPNFKDMQGFDPLEWPHVFIYIPTLDECAEILHPVIKAAVGMDYPADRLHILVLDDGKRSWLHRYVLTVASTVSCQLECIQREKVEGQPHHAKAGNMNHALLTLGLHGDFVLVLDADMVAHPSMIQRLLPFFYTRLWNGQWVSNNVAFVQTPQEFDNVVDEDPLDTAQTMWYQVTTTGREASNSVPFCGTNALLRVRPLLDIGGFKYGSLTEDLHTSITLHKCGWASHYLNETLAIGKAPHSIYDVFAQRIRWSVGAWTMLHIENPLFSKQLTLNQRICWFQQGGMPYVAMFYLIAIVAGTIRFYFVEEDLINQIAWALLLALILISRLSSLLSPGIGQVATMMQLWRDGTSFYTYLPIMYYVLWKNLLGIKLRFRVTNKVPKTDPNFGRWHPLCWFHVIIFCILFSVLMGFLCTSVIDSVKEVAFVFLNVYLLLSLWDVMVVCLNPLPTWPIAKNKRVCSAPNAAVGPRMGIEGATEPKDSNAVASRRERRIPTLDGLKGVCILSIILYHYSLQSVESFGHSPFFWTNVIGLPLWAQAALWPISFDSISTFTGLSFIFILTGFGLHYSLRKRNAKLDSVAALRQFYTRRASRLFVLYYINVLILWVQDMYSGTFDWTDASAWIDIVLTLTVTNQCTVKYFFPRVNGVLWSMGCSIWFPMLIFPWTYNCIGSYGMWRTLAVSLAFSACIVILGEVVFKLTLDEEHNVLTSGLLGTSGTMVLGQVVAELLFRQVNSERPPLPQAWVFVGKRVLLYLGYVGMCLMAYTTLTIRDMYDENARQWTGVSCWLMAMQEFVAPIFTACIILALVLNRHDSHPMVIERCLSLPPLQLLGLMVFSLYVWHYRPVQIILVGSVTPWGVVSLSVLSIPLLALLSYRFIECCTVLKLFDPFHL